MLCLKKGRLELFVRKSNYGSAAIDKDRVLQSQRSDLADGKEHTVGLEYDGENTYRDDLPPSEPPPNSDTRLRPHTRT